jgi:hypothetical protein
VKYGIIVSCVYPHETLQKCLESFNETLESRDSLKLLVEDGYNEREICKTIANTHGFSYRKCPTSKREPPNNWAVPLLWNDVDVIILAHSDVVFTNPNWLNNLHEAFEKAGPKIDCLNLSVDAVRYDTLQPVYQWRSTSEKHFGYTLDVHTFSRGSGNSGRRIARMSPCYAVRSSFLREHAQFDTDFDIELAFKLTQQKKWWFWLNNEPIQHRMGYQGGRDSDFIIARSFDEFVNPIRENTRSFERKFGINMENYLYHDLGNKRFQMWEDIVEAANNGYLEEFDGLLDEIMEDLKTGNHPDYIKMYGLEHTI